MESGRPDGPRARILFTVATLTCGLLLGATTRAGPGNNPEHVLNVYSLQEYGTMPDACDGYDKRWKHSIPLYSSQDPYESFWREMVDDCSGGYECANTLSRNRLDSEVTVDSMVREEGGWDDADLVFFFGHNTMIQPQWQSPYFERWIPDQGGHCVHSMADTGSLWPEWGTSSEPYRYHRNLVTSASLSNAYTVVYAYNPMTSALVGQDFHDFFGLGCPTENTWDQPVADHHYYRLGENRADWVIVHGCNGLTVAEYVNHIPGSSLERCPLGVNAWKKSWYHLRMVLGHYRSTLTSLEPYLSEFAASLKAGARIQEAYFDIHRPNNVPYPASFSMSNPALGMPSAMALGGRTGCCHEMMGIEVCWPGCYDAEDYIQDTWLDPMPEPTTSRDVMYLLDPWTRPRYVTAWKVLESMPLYRIHLLDPAVRAWIGDTIPVRRAMEGFKESALPLLRFADLGDARAERRLRSAAKRIFGDDASEARLLDNGNSYSLKLENGTAWVAKSTGAYTLVLADYDRGISQVKDAEQAVNLALEQILEADLLKLAEGETLEVVAVTSTHHASWLALPEKAEPVEYMDETTGELLPQYKSGHTVYLGRRYRDVPMFGGTFAARLDASGRLVAVHRWWRDIEGESDPPVKLLSPDELEKMRNPEYVEKLRLTQWGCGYVESPSVGYAQPSPGVGCVWHYDNPAGAGSLAAEVHEWLSAAADSDLPLQGKPSKF